MSYITSSDHFINILNKLVRENDDIDKGNLLEAAAYIELIYDKKLGDAFTWASKNDPHLLENENLLKWLQYQNVLGSQYLDSHLESIMTAEFRNILKDLNNVSGVYSFWSKSDIPIYIGVSLDLHSRALSSFGDRFRKYKTEVYFKYISTETSTDAAVLEVYFIGKLKPSLNGSSKYGDSLTLKILKEPKFSKRILCNRIKEAKQK